MIRHRLLLVRSPLLLALVACQPVAKPIESSDTGDDLGGDVLIRQVPDQNAGPLVFPPPASGRHPRSTFLLDDKDQPMAIGQALQVRSPYTDDDGSFEFSGRTFRVVFNNEIDLGGKKPSPKKPVLAAADLLKIEPAVAGKAQWTAQNVLEFTAADHFDPQTTYTVTVDGVANKDGKKLEKAWTATFKASIAYSTAGKTLTYLPEPGKARLITLHPMYGDKVGRKVQLAAVFDQPVDLATIGAQIKLSDGDGERQVKLAYARGRKFQGVDVDPKQVVIVKPARALRPGDALSFEAWDHDQSAGAGTTRDFTVAEPLELTGVTCGYSYDESQCEWKEPEVRMSTRELWLNYSNAIGSDDKAIKAGISVSPAIANLSVWVTNGWDGDGQVRLSGEFKPSSRYTVTIPEIKDRFDFTTGGPRTIEVVTAALPASVSMPEGALILDEEHSRAFTVTTRNVESGELVFWPVEDDSADALARARALVSSRNLPPEAPPIVLAFRPSPQENEFVETRVDLLGQLKAGKSYIASIRIGSAAFDAKPMAYPSWSTASRPPAVLLTPGDARSLAIHAHSLTDATVLHVARLASGEPVKGATISLNGEVIRGRVTDDTGVVTVPMGLDRLRSGVLKVDDGKGTTSQIQLSAETTRERTYFPEFANGAAIRADDLRGMAITDRGIYRPGSTVFIKASVRKKVGKDLVPVASQPVRIRILGPMDDELEATNAITDDMGSVASSYVAPASARLGDYQILVEDVAKTNSDDVLARTTIKVSEFETPRFTVDVDARAPAPKKLEASVVGRYLFGAPMDGAELEWTLSRESASLPSGVFTDGGLRFDARQRSWWDDEPGDDRWSRSGRGTLAADGTVTVKQDLDLGKSVAPQRFTLEADVADTSYRHVAGRASVVVHPFDRYVGVKLPKPWTGVNEPVEVALGVIDQDGKPVVGAAIKARLERSEWHYTKTRSSSGSAHYEWHQTRSEVDSCTATSAAIAATCTLTPPRSGDYTVIAEVDGHRGGEASFWAWRYGDDDDAVFPSRGRTVEITPDKQRYAAGETAKLMIRSPYPAATAILTLEQGGLLTHQSLRLSGSTHVFEVPITAAHAPQLHAVVTLLPIDAPTESKAEWKIGAVRLPVALGDARLGVEVRADRETYEPGESVTIAVEVKDGSKLRQGAEVALAVVDEGILRLTNFHAADPVTALRPGMPLRFEIADTRTGLAALLGLSKTAGDGMAGEEGESARKNFVETALWRPDLRTDKDGLAKVTFTLPDNLTRFRMMAVVLDDKGKGGNAESSFTVRKPLMMIPAVPRFAAVGDTFEAAAMLHNNEERPQKATVSLGSERREVELAASSHQRIAFPIHASVAGELDLEFSLADGGGKVRDKVIAKVPVDAPGVGERPRLDGVFVGSQVIELKVPSSALVGKDSDPFVSVRVGQHLWPELGARLEFLLDYPHGCVEQTTSGLLPLLAARDILPRIGFTALSRDELDKRIKSGLERLTTMKTSSGGLGYWPGDSSPNVYGTAYAIRAMITAQKAGIALPSGLLDGALDYLDDQLFSVSEPEVQAAIAQSLAEVGKLPASSLDALFDRKDQQGVFGLASLAIAFGTFDDQKDRTAGLLDELEGAYDAEAKLTRPAKSEDFYYYGSNTRTRAQTAIALGRLRKGSHLYQKLVHELSQIDDSYTTQSTAYSLLAVAEQLRGTPAKGAEVRATLDGSALASHQELPGGSLEFRIPVADLRGKSARLELASPSTAAIAFMVHGKWMRALDDAGSLASTSADMGPDLYRVITDAKGDQVDLAHITPGQVLRVSLLAKLPVGKIEWGRMSYLALTDRLPAGFEPVQTDLWSVARAPEITENHPFYQRLRWGGSDASFIELHDERVNVYFDRVWGDEVIATYLVRALTPGTYAHPPASAEFMYIGESTSYSEAGKVVVE